MGKRIYEWKRNFYFFRWNTEIRHVEKWKAIRLMSKENYLNRIKDLPETVKQFGGLVIIVLLIFFSFSILNIIFGGGDELVRKMK